MLIAQSFNKILQQGFCNTDCLKTVTEELLMSSFEK